MTAASSPPPLTPEQEAHRILYRCLSEVLTERVTTAGAVLADMGEADPPRTLGRVEWARNRAIWQAIHTRGTELLAAYASRVAALSGPVDGEGGTGTPATAQRPSTGVSAGNCVSGERGRA